MRCNGCGTRLVFNQRKTLSNVGAVYHNEEGVKGFCKPCLITGRKPKRHKRADWLLIT